MHRECRDANHRGSKIEEKIGNRNRWNTKFAQKKEMKAKHNQHTLFRGKKSKRRKRHSSEAEVSAAEMGIGQGIGAACKEWKGRRADD